MLSVTNRVRSFSWQKVGIACENGFEHAAELEVSGRTLPPSPSTHRSLLLFWLIMTSHPSSAGSNKANVCSSYGSKDDRQTWPRPSPWADALSSYTCAGRCPPWPTVCKRGPRSSRSGSASWMREDINTFPLNGSKHKHCTQDVFLHQTHPSH